jgi:hypothetical protein
LITNQRIIRTWWPLAASWLLMSAEMPAMSAIVARLPDPEINLAAYGGIVFPLAMLIESPIIMLLSASTALSKDWQSYRKVYNYMLVAGAALTVLHAVIAFTPLYDWLVRNLLGSPEAIIEPARLGLKIMLPWTWSIAYRRFHQGVLIRFEHSRSVGVGTVIRLSSNVIVLLAGYLSGKLPGIAVATMAVIAGVVAEAIYVGIVVQPVLRRQVRPAPAATEPLSMAVFMRFYIPLVLTSLISLLVQPIGSAMISRMPLAIESLAAWSVVSGLAFMLRSLGIAYNEVVVALLDTPGSYARLRSFAWLLAALTSLALLVITATPLAGFWFERVSGLNSQLSQMATTSLWFFILSPAFASMQSWFQGTLLNSRHTRPITESVVVFLVVCITGLGAGVAWGRHPGLYIAAAASILAMLAQTSWQALRSQPDRHQFAQRDATLAPAAVSD